MADKTNTFRLDWEFAVYTKNKNSNNIQHWERMEPFGAFATNEN